MKKSPEGRIKLISYVLFFLLLWFAAGGIRLLSVIGLINFIVTLLAIIAAALCIVFFILSIKGLNKIELNAPLSESERGIIRIYMDEKERIIRLQKELNEKTLWIERKAKAKTDFKIHVIICLLFAFATIAIYAFGKAALNIEVDDLAVRLFLAVLGGLFTIGQRPIN